MKQLSLLERRTKEERLLDKVVLAPNASDHMTILGTFLFKTINETYVPEEKLADLWLEAGLPPEHLPSPIAPHTAFTDAVRKLEGVQKDIGGPVHLLGRHTCTRGEVVHLNGTYHARLLVRSVTKNHHEIVYHLIRETVLTNKKRKTLIHRTFGTLRWDRQNKTPSFEWELKSQGEENIRRQVEEVFWDTYNLRRTHYDSGHIRYMVDKLLAEERIFKLTLTAASHFVPRKKAWISEGLRDFFKSIQKYAANPERPATCWPVPALRNEDTTTLVKDSFLEYQKELVKEIGGHLQRLENLTDEQREKAIERVKQRVLKTREEVAELLDEYRALLDAKFDTVERNVTLLTSIVAELDGGRIPKL